MIKFITPSTIEGEIKLASPKELIEIENNFTTPTVMQLQISCGTKKVIRDVVFLKDKTHLCQPIIPKEFIESTSKIYICVLIFTADGAIPTNKLEVVINKKAYAMLVKASDRIDFLENKVGELERLIMLSVVGKRLPLKIPPDLGEPRTGMVMTVLAKDVFGWSDLFKEVITQINEIKTIDGKVVLTASDINLADGNSIQKLSELLIENNKTLAETLEVMKTFADDLSIVKQDIIDLKNQDVL